MKCQYFHPQSIASRFLLVLHNSNNAHIVLSFHVWYTPIHMYRAISFAVYIYHLNKSSMSKIHWISTRFFHFVSVGPSYHSPPSLHFCLFAVYFLEHPSKAVKLIHAKKSNSILIEMNAITSYHQKYANVSLSVSSKALEALPRNTEKRGRRESSWMTICR